MPFDQAYDPLRSLQAAWKLLKQAPLTVLLGTFLPALVQVIFGSGLQFLLLPLALSAGNRHGDETVFLILLVAGSCVVSLFFFVFQCWIDAGFGRAVEAVARTGQDRSELVFAGAKRLGTLLLARLLAGLVCLLAGLPFFVGFVALSLTARRGSHEAVFVAGLAVLVLAWVVALFYIGLGLALVNVVAVIEDVSATQAIVRSWQLARGQRLRLLVFFIVQFLLVIAGLCVCLIGVLLAAPLVMTMQYEAYIALTKGEQYPHWWIGSGRFPFDEPKPEDYGSPPAPPPVPPPLPPQN